MEMIDKERNIYPITKMNRAEKELLIHQHGQVIWFTGLSGSGKSTLAVALEKALHERGILCTVLDGDNIRSGINNNLGFSAEDRVENIRRIAEVSKLFVETGVVVLAAFISPKDTLRQMVSDIVGKDNFIEVYVSTSLEVCENRDVKGLYEKARAGILKEFTGVSAPFEVPLSPDIVIDTAIHPVEESVDLLLQKVLPYVVKE